MTAAAEPDPPPPRLNPFAFPSDTTFRFLLLVVSIVGVSLFLFNWLYFSVADNRADLRAQEKCPLSRGSVLGVFRVRREREDAGGGTNSAPDDRFAEQRVLAVPSPPQQPNGGKISSAGREVGHRESGMFRLELEPKIASLHR